MDYLFQKRCLLQVLQNFKRGNLKTFKESLLRISRPSLPHSAIVAGKNEFLKKWLMVLILDILSIWLFQVE